MQTISHQRLSSGVFVGALRRLQCTSSSAWASHRSPKDIAAALVLYRRWLQGTEMMEPWRKMDLAQWICRRRARKRELMALGKGSARCRWDRARDDVVRVAEAVEKMIRYSYRSGRGNECPVRTDVQRSRARGEAISPS